MTVGRRAGEFMTFLMTDIEGSTRLWDLDPEGMARALVLHDRLVEATVVAHDGTFVKARGEGDSTFSIFVRAGNAVRAAIEVRDRLERTDWPAGITISVRSGLHTGEAIARDGDFYGPTVNRAARVRALGVGGQILVSSETASRVRGELPQTCELVDLGTYELKGLTAPERVFAVAQPGNPRRAVTPGICPYPGLLAFQVSDKANFFGRESLIARLVHTLLAKGRAVVVGASGSGKSSLIRAGVVPALPADRPVALFTPGSRPLEALDSARAECVASDCEPILVVDQLEEIFTMCEAVADRRAFLDALVQAARIGSGLVVTLRADFYGRFTEHADFASLISSEQELLGPMSDSELREVIEHPAQRAGLRFESGLVDTIVGDVMGEPGALPLVSHVLRETWRRREGNTLTRAGYAAAGGAHGAIARTADSIYDHMTEAQRRTMRGVLLRLTELGEGGNDRRRRASVAELFTEGAADATEVLEILVDARLVTIDVDTAEVAHEALIREWPRLRAWVDDGREELRLLRELGAAADAWTALHRDPGALYRGARLAATLDWLAGDPSIEPTARERAFIDASRMAQEREIEATRTRLRRTRQLLAGIAVALVVAIVLGGIALAERNRADDQTTRARAATKNVEIKRLVAESKLLPERDRPLSALLAVAANRLADTPETRGALASLLVGETRLRATMFGKARRYRGLAYTPDGRMIVARGTHAVDFLDVQKRHVASSLELDHSGVGFALDAAGSRMAIGDDRGTIRQWDVKTQAPIGDAISFGDAIAALAYSPDGKTLGVVTGSFGSDAPYRPDTVVLGDADSGARRPITSPATRAR
jgi:class 3 adenylate cyclase